jgi:hypothetical protein
MNDENKARRRRTSEGAIADPGANLLEVESETWSAIESEQRVQLMGEMSSRYYRYLDELHTAANLCVERYQTYSSEHSRWRRMLIIGTGLIAIINLLAANSKIARWAVSDINIVPVTAAVAAIVLTILANLESYYNWANRAQAYRESRELFLDAAREFERAWNVYVRPFGDSPEAWANGVELYKRIAAKDRQLRSAFKELTKTENKSGSKS